MKIPPPPADPKALGGGSVPPPPASSSELASPDTPAEGLGTRFARFLADKGPAIAGGMMGASVGSIAGPGGAVAGAAMGGAAGEAIKKDVQYLTGAKDPAQDKALENLADISTAGVAQAGAEGAGQLTKAGIQAMIARYGNTLARVGGQLSKITASVPENYATAVIKDPGILERAMTPEDLGVAYTNFEKTNGLRGLESHVIDTEGRLTMSAAEYERMVVRAAKKVFAQKAAEQALTQASESGEAAANHALLTQAESLAREAGDPPTAQELYLASQAASKLKMMAKFGEPQAQMAAASAALNDSKDLIDQGLEEMIPGYQKLRQAAFESHAREAFDSLLPLNKGGTPNVLKSLAGVATGPVGMATVSPAGQAATIKAIAAAAPAAADAARAATGLAAAGLSDRARRILGY